MLIVFCVGFFVLMMIIFIDCSLFEDVPVFFFKIRVSFIMSELRLWDSKAAINNSIFFKISDFFEFLVFRLGWSAIWVLTSTTLLSLGISFGINKGFSFGVFFVFPSFPYICEPFLGIVELVTPEEVPFLLPKSFSIMILLACLSFLNKNSIRNWDCWFVEHYFRLLTDNPL